jgi:hypothetical protein
MGRKVLPAQFSPVRASACPRTIGFRGSNLQATFVAEGSYASAELPSLRELAREGAGHQSVGNTPRHSSPRSRLTIHIVSPVSANGPSGSVS